ncbi:AraC family transcriptional regulator [Paenibacillus aurantius]|uniref:AraC family transcriptional regulator n=1 Tax=Paenibacillus aurantius TaxID=2918900 RepID=A0AA96LF22_9BACL|nr:AraC family transcriptional regulator [Paenibacillus aurantius]WJH36502.1 AraC family transcriptional regulator [Paenibacillus sp. CC-CFT747]WNQ11838.1 AraC family transcriptional regulator [Paenibacillus aurantius]
MTALSELKENTELKGRTFPINVFPNRPVGEQALYLHWHEHLEIIYMRSGQAVFDIGGRTYPAEAGDLLFVNSRELHSGFSVNNTRVEFHAIVFSPSLLGSQEPDPLHGQFVLPFLEGSRRFPGRIGRGDKLYRAFAGPVKAVLAEFERRQPGYELAIRAQLHLLLAAALRHQTGLGAPETGAQGQERKLQRFEKLFPYIKEHYPSRISVEEAASLVSMSPFHFCKTFKKLTGRTFVEFVNLHRVNEAERLLRETGLTVTEVAERVGFCSINYFDRTFKQYKHYNPSRCRRQERE